MYSAQQLHIGWAGQWFKKRKKLKKSGTSGRTYPLPQRVIRTLIGKSQ